MVTQTTSPQPNKDEPSRLKFSRKPGEDVLVGERIRVVRTTSGWLVTDGEVSLDLDSGTPGRGGLCVMAPRSVHVVRGELTRPAA